AGLMEHTLIIFTSDHGDFLGDHSLGEKELLYDAGQRVPFILGDPRRPADATRGMAPDRMVESLAVAPTLRQALRSTGAWHRIRWRSLLPLLAGGPGDWRAEVYSELDYSFRHARQLLGQTPQIARAWSLRTDRWRYVYWLDQPEQLYDLQSDPDQF